MWTWIIRLIGGWIPTGSKPFGEWIGKIIWVVGIILVVSFATNIWEKFFPQKPNVVNVAGNYVQEAPTVAHFGCSIWRANMKVWYAK